jgi:hypothetical protein
MSLISPPPITNKGVDERGIFQTGWINFFNSLYKTLNCLGNSGTSVIYVATNAGSYTYPKNMESLFLNPAASISSFTVNLPVNPIDGQPVYISSTQAISSLAIAATLPATVSGSPVVLTANSGCAFRYNKSTNKWFRFL